MTRHCKNEKVRGRCGGKGHRLREHSSADGDSASVQDSGAIEMSNLSVEVLNKAVGASNGVRRFCFDGSHEISMTE